MRNKLENVVLNLVCVFCMMGLIGFIGRQTFLFSGNGGDQSLCIFVILATIPISIYLMYCFLILIVEEMKWN